MDATTERIFTFKGRSFTLKLNETSDGYTVISYWRGRPVSPAYRVCFLREPGHHTQNKDVILDVLFCRAQLDIEHGLYFDPRTPLQNLH
jgi:hypothetical protein